MAHVPPERRPILGRRRTAVPPDAWPPNGPTAPLTWVPDPRFPADDVAAPRPSWPVPEPEPEPRPRRPWRRDPSDRADPPRPRRPRRGTLVRRLAKLVVAAAVVSLLLMLPLRWIDPPTTAFMAANPDGAVQQSVPIEHVSRNFLAAVVAHEDSQLPYRTGAFDWDQLFDRARAHMTGQEDPSGSTIPQQVAKNLFLNQELSAGRKMVEAGLSMELALLIDDRRMLELYVNYAQFGPTLYGVCAASWYYFDTPPQHLPLDQAVQLVGLLPSPGHVQRASGGGLDFDVEDGLGWLSRSHVLNAQNRVPRHIDDLGFRPVEDLGVDGLASEQPPSDDDCSTRPREVADLIAAEGTA
jgi:monofunctional glycosyltransferase